MHLRMNKDMDFPRNLISAGISSAIAKHRTVVIGADYSKGGLQWDDVADYCTRGL